MYSLKIKPIEKYHLVSKFDCGDDELNDFIKNDAFKQKNAGWNTTYVVTENNKKKVIGFFALTTDTINLTKKDKKKYGKKYCGIPAIKIGRFAIDKKFQFKGIGSKVLSYAIGHIITNICPLIGGIYITLDAYPHKKDWYINHFNFRENTMINNSGNRLINLILPIKNFRIK